MNRYEEFFLKSGEPFTYGELCERFNDGKMCREADKTLQKWRKKGWLTVTRVGRRHLWRTTDKGREEVVRNG